MNDKIIFIYVAIVVSVFLYVGHVLLAENTLKKMKQERRRGYSDAVRDILEHNIYYDTINNKYQSLSIIVQDEETTPYWEDRFRHWFQMGEHCALDTFVKAGIINKRTGERLKRLFERSALAMFERYKDENAISTVA